MNTIIVVLYASMKYGSQIRRFLVCCVLWSALLWPPAVFATRQAGEEEEQAATSGEMLLDRRILPTQRDAHALRGESGRQHDAATELLEVTE